LAGTLPDILFPPFVGMVGLLSLRAATTKWSGLSRVKKMVRGLVYIPSLFGGCLSVLVVILMITPPFFTLGFIFMMSERQNEVLIQQAVSPDGLRVAEVYFRPVGAYGSGNGRVLVRVKYPLFPVVERDVYFLNASYVDKNTPRYLSWTDNDMLYITETQEALQVGSVGLKLSSAIVVPVNLFYYYQSRRLEQKLTAPVSDVPIYPGDVRGDHSRYAEEFDTVLRGYSVWDRTTEEIVEWYQQALSKAPWSVVQVQHDIIETSNATNTEYCIQVQRRENGETRIYYWEIRGRDRNTLVNIRIGTPNPISETCLRYLNNHDASE
jgi:hypothetical protein